MIIIDAVSWWYGWGWLHVFEVMKRRLARLYNIFSIRQMLKTLFAPWKEDRVTGAQGLDQMMRALVMNTVARLIGFSVRTMIILFWALISIVMLVVGIVVFVIWPLTPLLIIGLILMGITL
jgi:hypothetical protein